MKKKTSKKQINESKSRIMPSKYLIRFKSRIINARQGAPGDVEKAVEEFYKMYGRKIQNPDFTPENLMKLADRIQGEGGSENIIGNGRHMGQNGNDSWWGMNIGGQMEEEAIPINESDLRSMIKECVKRLVKEYNDYDGWLAHQEAKANPGPSPIEDSCQYISDNLFDGVADKVKEAQNFVAFLRKDSWLMRKYQKDINNYMQSLRNSTEDEDWNETPQTGDPWVDGLLSLDYSGDLNDFFSEVFYPGDLDSIVKEWFEVDVWNDGPDY